MSRYRFVVAAATILGFAGVASAWYLAATSSEAEAARQYLEKSPEAKTKFGQVHSSWLTGFRITNHNAYLTFWVRTADGRKFMTLVVDKTTQPPVVRLLEQ